MTLEEIKEQVSSDDNFHNWQLLFESCAMFDYGRLENAIGKVSQRYAESQTQEIQEQKEELVEMLSLVCIDLEERGRAYGDAYTMSKELLTKYNHLNKNP